MIDTEGLSTFDYCHKRLFNYCRLNGYSKTNTWQVYRAILNQILEKFPEPENVGLIAIQDFASSFTNDNTRRNICIILRWLFNTVYEKNLDWKSLPYPQRKKKVQPIYTLDELLKILNSITNEKQKAMLALIIDCGLRVSEPCAIFLKDCSSKERKIVLRSAKGDEDRIIYPSQHVWDLIRIYWNVWDKKPETYLFEGLWKNKPYTASSIRGFLETHCIQVGVKYKGVHAIRRFTGTWWIENKVPLTVAAEKMGHSTTRTLEKHYAIHSPTYLRDVTSPLTPKAA